eukprot:1319738-Rhodomonas_salina.1
MLAPTTHAPTQQHQQQQQLQRLQLKTQPPITPRERAGIHLLLSPCGLYQWSRGLKGGWAAREQVHGAGFGVFGRGGEEEEEGGREGPSKEALEWQALE